MTDHRPTHDETDEYRQAVASDHWRSLRRQVIEQQNHTCHVCGQVFLPGDLNLHHLHYQTLGHETDDDVQLVCISCHPKVDAERVHRGRSARYEKGFDGWMRRQFGDDWQEEVAPAVADAERKRFDKWIGVRSSRHDETRIIEH